jgi:hypothetical protein
MRPELLPDRAEERCYYYSDTGARFLLAVTREWFLFTSQNERSVARRRTDAQSNRFSVSLPVYRRNREVGNERHTESG